MIHALCSIESKEMFFEESLFTATPFMIFPVLVVHNKTYVNSASKYEQMRHAVVGKMTFPKNWYFDSWND